MPAAKSCLEQHLNPASCEPHPFAGIGLGCQAHEVPALGIDEEGKVGLQLRTRQLDGAREASDKLRDAEPRLSGRDGTRISKVHGLVVFEV